MRERSVKTRDDLAETGWGQRVIREGTQVRRVGLIRELQGEWETQERIMTHSTFLLRLISITIFDCPIIAF
jgi:hypothetical protein